MHHVTTHGAHKITMDSKERDYQERLRQAKAQGDGNPNVMGVQEPPIKEAQIVTAANTPVEQAQNVSGDAELGTSMTESASKILMNSKPMLLSVVLGCTPRLQAMPVTASTIARLPGGFDHGK